MFSNSHFSFFLSSLSLFFDVSPVTKEQVGAIGGIFLKTNHAEDRSVARGGVSQDDEQGVEPGGGGYRAASTDKMVAGMKAGSITVILAAEDKGLGAGGAYCDFADGMGRGRRERGGRIY